LTDDARKKLVQKLATAGRFDVNYAAESRSWFVDRLARLYDAQGLSDADIESNVTDVMTKSVALVKTKREFKIGLSFSKALAKINLGRYVEILYGAIAWHPEFVDPANSAMLDFIANRRMRAVARMKWWVNPNHKGYFRYPSTCPADETWRVNVDAQVYWKSPSSGQYPITLIRTGGTPNLETAVSTIWTAKKKPCDGNLLDCATTATTVFMDSLFEAKDRRKLLQKIDSKNPTNLAINHVNGNPNDSFVTDNSAEGLFSKDNRLVGDLEVGDHAYIYNHPLYTVFKPVGSWSGEHSLVFNGGDRTIKSKNGILFGGHGKIGTVFDFYDAFLRELQTDLHRAYRIGAIFLAWLDSGKTLFPGQVTSTNDTVQVDGTPNVPYELSVFTVSFKFNNFQKPATKKGLAQTSETGFAVAYFQSLHRFYISRKKTAADTKADGVVKKSIPMQMDATVIGSDFDPVNWKVIYYDTTNARQRYKLYQKVKGKLAFRPLTIDELFDSPFMKSDPTKKEVYTTTPRVDFGAAYQTFLTTNGGI